MADIKISDFRVRLLKSYWLGQTQVRCRAREIGDRKKIMVDMMIITPGGVAPPSNSEIEKIANTVAQKLRVTSFDHTVIRDFSTERHYMNIEQKMVHTHVREVCRAYQGY